MSQRKTNWVLLAQKLFKCILCTDMHNVLELLILLKCLFKSRRGSLKLTWILCPRKLTLQQVADKHEKRYNLIFCGEPSKIMHCLFCSRRKRILGRKQRHFLFSTQHVWLCGIGCGSEYDVLEAKRDLKCRWLPFQFPSLGNIVAFPMGSLL